MGQSHGGPIVLVGPVHPLRGGIAQFTAQVHDGLSRSHRVEVISFTRQYPGWLFPGRTQLDESRSVQAVPASRMIDSIAPWTWWRTAARITTLQPSAVIFMHWMSFFGPAYGTIARRVKAGSNARIVFLCHNLYPHEPRGLDRMLTRYGMRDVDGILALSESVARDSRRFAPRADVRCVPHPVPTTFGPLPSAADARRRHGLPPDELVLLFFGHIRGYKGLPVLLRALPQILAQRRCRLLIAGEFYEPRGAYDRLIADLGIGDRVTIIDRYLANEEVPDVFAAADVCVLPYLSATQSGVAKVAYGFGTPVIATDVGGLAEEVVDGVTGYVVAPRDPASIAAAVERFAEARATHDFAAAISRLRARFSWAPLISALEEMAVRP
jgi:D-inositol-3-phosphate glycosyltransferase